MSEILLTHSYMLDLDPKQKRIGQPWAPLGTMYAASVLKADGHSIHFWDPTFLHDPDSVRQALNVEKPALLVIYDDGFSYLSKMCLSNMRDVALRMAGIGKECGATVIICSSDASDNYELYLRNNADFVILGEGELTLKELANTLLTGTGASAEEIKGCAFLKDGKIKVNPRRELISDPDILPFPSWDMLNVEQYRKTWRSRNRFFSMNMVTTRGCPYSCIWCAKPIYGNHYSSRSPLDVVQEMAYLQNTFKPDHIWFADDIFGLKPGWLVEFARLAEIHQVHLPFSIQSRVDLLLSGNQIQALAKAGCRKVWLGVESGSQKILDAMQKGITVEHVRTVSPLIRQAGIEQAFFIQLGFPGETKADIQKTIRLLVDLMPDDIGISVTYPLPGTKFYDSVSKSIKEKTNWKDSDDLSILFNSTNSPGYYKLMHRYIHKYFRYKQSVYYLKAIFKSPAGITYSRLRRIVLLPYYLFFSIAFQIILKTRENG